MPQRNHTADMADASAYGDAMKLPTDAELLTRTTHGDEAAFRELLNRHGRYLYGVAHSLIQNAADAEDLVQETLVAALNGSFRGESQVRTWLVGILVRRAGMLRRSKHYRMPGLESQPQTQAPESQTATGGIDAKIDLSVMLQGLSPEHRQVIVLRELEGLSYDEMAKAIGVPRGTVESRLHRAREELRRRFRGYAP